ncbi:MAG: hypothetical protein Q9162_006170 [Coniocarpon cinnabarinum]
MLCFLRAPHPPRAFTANSPTLTYEDGAASLRWNGPDQKYAMTHTLPPRNVNVSAPASLVQPPLHYHIYQTEHFHVSSGTGNFFIGLDREPTHVLGSTGVKSAASVSNGRYHRFENASTTEPLVVDIRLDPQDYENEQRFFRNFFGYLDDCRKAKAAPSLFQLMVFLNAADTPLALPVPLKTLETNVGVWMSRGFMVGMAMIGRSMGYQESYREYYEPSRSK